MKLQTHKHPILPILDSCTFHFICFFPNSFSYGVFANIGSGAASGGQVPGGSGKVPGQVPNHAFREGSGQVPNDRFQEGCGAGSERQVPEQVLNHVPNHGFQEVRGSGTGSERQVPGQVPNQVPNHGFRGRFRGTGFRRDGYRTVLARFLDFRKKAYDL